MSAERASPDAIGDGNNADEWMVHYSVCDSCQRHVAAHLRLLRSQRRSTNDEAMGTSNVSTLSRAKR